MELDYSDNRFCSVARNSYSCKLKGEYECAVCRFVFCKYHYRSHQMECDGVPYGPKIEPTPEPVTDDDIPF